MSMKDFKRKFEELGYTFQNLDVLEDIYQFYKYYENDANKGVATMILEGDPGSGKTYMYEVFSKLFGEDVECVEIQCVEETNSDKLIATYNVPAIVRNEADKSVVAGVLTKAINLANQGKKVVLLIDELDKARFPLDSYFLTFLEKGKTDTIDNEIISTTKETIKNLYVFITKNDERSILDALRRRCFAINLPPMPPVLAYKALLKVFKNSEHDAKFLKFVCKVYEAIYNEQMNNDGRLLSRLPALQELIVAITSDYVLYEEGISSTRRIASMIRKLGKDTNSQEIITDILTKNFNYKNRDSNYENEKLDYDMKNSEDFMDDKGSLIEQYIEKKDNGEYLFEEEAVDDPMKDIASIFDNIKDDQALAFLDNENKEKIIELGVITHQNPQVLNVLFNKIRFQGNPNSRFCFLTYENDNFIGLIKYKNTLILIANKEYVSPKLFMQAISIIITEANELHEAEDLRLTSLNAKILSNIPHLALDKMSLQNGEYVYHKPNLKIVYDDSLNINFFHYMQKHKAEPLYQAIVNICIFNPELFIPVSFIQAKKFMFLDERLVRKYSQFIESKDYWESYKTEGWEVIIDDFLPIKSSFVDMESDTYVFKWEVEENEIDKTIHMYPVYKLKGDYLIFNCDSDFDKVLEKLSPVQKEIALFARSIFGNFIPMFDSEQDGKFFSFLTMLQTACILENENVRIDLSQDITREQDFINYYDSISQPRVAVPSEKVFKRTK